MRKRAVISAPIVLLALAATILAATGAGAAAPHSRLSAGGEQPGPRTPIRHLVVIFQENVSFDHYFGTYPQAANTDGQSFRAADGTPAVDGLLPARSRSLPPSLRHSTNLLAENPNTALPQRLDSTPTGAPQGAGGQLTCDQGHNYSDEQRAFNGGAMDRFVQSVGNGGGKTPFGTPCQAGTVMDYYDGNTVTGLWNYAQQYAMSDNSYGTTFGPSSPGAINLVAGTTGGVDMTHTANNPSIATATSPNADLAPDGQGGYSLTGDAQPYWDDCSTRDAVALSGRNVGDELNAAGLSWGWFQGGMRPTTSYAQALAATKHEGQPTSTFVPDQFKSAGFNGSVPHSSNQGLCNAVHAVGGALGGSGQYGYKDDYIPHHEPLNYYASTANPHHLTIPTDESGHDTLTGLSTIGSDTQSYVGGVPQFDKPNHNYDVTDFDQLVAAISNGQLPASALPAVSFLKAPGYQDGHAAYSDPADEQAFIAQELNALMRSPDWSETAVVIAYDDSDGWYDHAYSGVSNPSLSPAENLTNTTFSGPTSGECGPSPQTTAPLAGEQGRCGFGPRLPLVVISPFARRNYVDHKLSSQSSILNLVEYNWRLPAIAGSADQLVSGLSESAQPFDLAGMFRFHGRENRPLILDPSTGQPVGGEQR
ncbi:MAG TPA: alkaline phosphatase family protein [Solirubrobacteraceae bacterium]|nr:alkaline phosphatase family protein [Solirubrobacteraceae bacterium]